MRVEDLGLGFKDAAVMVGGPCLFCRQRCLPSSHVSVNAAVFRNDKLYSLLLTRKGSKGSFGVLFGSSMGGCQNSGPFLGALNIRCRTIMGTQKGTIILTTTHIRILTDPAPGPSKTSSTSPFAEQDLIHYMFPALW